jgi:hypothetical protein
MRYALSAMKTELVFVALNDARLSALAILLGVSN